MPGETDPEITMATRSTLPDLSLPATGRDPCLLQLYPPGLAIETRHVLGDKALVLGRSDDCDIQLDDVLVSRRHARIEPGPDGYWVVDLDSTNGVYVNEMRVASHKLKDGDYLYLGNTIYRFLSGGSVEAAYHEQIHRLAIIDPLTGVHNKRSLLEFLGRELGRSARYHRALALVMFDVDRFKAINEELGHLGGDLTLRELAARVRGVLRQEAMFARYGGDEFAVVLPETTPEEGARVAARIREQVESRPFEYEGKEYPVTLGVGVAAVTGPQACTPQELIRQADEHLFQSKRSRQTGDASAGAPTPERPVIPRAEA